MSLEKKLNYYTKLSTESRAKALRWMARQNEELILITFEKQKVNYFNLSKSDEENRSILYLASIYVAAEELYTLLQAKKNKNKKQNLYEVKNVTSLQAKQFKKHQKTEKWDKLLNLKNKIFELIEDESFSYREVSRFLQKYHKLEVSHTYIGDFYNATKDQK